MKNVQRRKNWQKKMIKKLVQFSFFINSRNKECFGAAFELENPKRKK